MTVNEITPGKSAAEVVVACTLSEADLASQSERWKKLREGSEVRQVVTSEGKQVYFRADDSVLEELNELVAVETDCCSWAQWKVEPMNGEVVLRVTSTGSGIEAVHGMFKTPGASTPCCEECG